MERLAVDTTSSSSATVRHSPSSYTGPPDTAPTAEKSTADPAIVKDDPNLFDYTYAPPSKSAVRKFDPTSQLGDQLTDLSSDMLNNLTTDTKEEQIRICSLNINGLTDTNLGLLQNYMDLKKLDVMALQNTRLSLSESNRLAGLIRR